MADNWFIRHVFDLPQCCQHGSHVASATGQIGNMEVMNEFIYQKESPGMLPGIIAIYLCTGDA
jgi:hypothetical protein